MARSADHALLRAVKKRDSYGRTLSEQRLMVEDAARAANMLTGRSISVSGGFGSNMDHKAEHVGGKKSGRGL